MSQPPQPPQQPQRVIPIDNPGYAPYGMPVPPRLPSRPGILTALGVVSIVLACLMVISNCGSIVSVMVISATTKALNAAMASAAAATQQAAAARDAEAAGDGVKPRGLPQKYQLIVAVGLSRQHRLSPPRNKMLHKLVAEAGQDMFVMDADQLTPSNVAANVSQSGQLPGVGNKLGNDYFIIGNGGLELADDHAVFAPSGGGEVVRVYEKVSTESTDEEDANAPPGRAVMPATMPNVKAPVMSDRAVMLSVLDAVLGCILAVFLFICGLFVLRDSKAARRMHVAWAVLKLPLAVLGGVAMWMMMHDMGASSGQNAGQEIVASMTTMIAVLLACIYPIVVLIVMNLKTAREYYATGSAR